MKSAILVRKGNIFVNGEYSVTITAYAGDAHASFIVKTPKGEYIGSFTDAKDAEGFFYATRELLVRVSRVNDTVVLTW